ncbi:MAG: hypothetical protein ACAH65_00485 [Chloroflexota bacterium]
MKRFAFGLALVGVLLLPGTTLAFHHGGLPSTDCAAEAAGSPSNDNGQAKEAINEFSPFGAPLPPASVIGSSPLEEIPGNGAGEGGEVCEFG